MDPCAFCRSSQELIAHRTITLCTTCAAHLGRTLSEHPDRLSGLWPALVEDEDDDDPEPRVRLADGTSVELRERTAALKRDLSVAERAELADTFARIGLVRECLLECAWVLSQRPPEALVEQALARLFPRPLAAEQIQELQGALFPC